MSEHPQLDAYLDTARWFGGKGRGATVTAIERIASTEGDPVLSVDLVTVSYDDGGEDEVYQLPLANYLEPQDRLEHALVGHWDDGRLGGAHVWAYDAVHDRDAMARYLTAFAETEGSREVAGLTFHRVAGHDVDTEAHSTLFTGEQSNSSVAFGEDSVMKVFRKITPGVNPDIVVHEVLTRAESEHVAQLYGWVEARHDGQVLHLAMLQQFLRTGSDGWDLAQASVRNLLSEADLHADEVGGDFAGEATRLGTALAEVHQVLAEHFPTHDRTPAEMGELADAMRRRLDAALEVAPQLADFEPALRAAYDAVAALPGSEVQTVHGDLHLGQTLRTVKGWKIVDFEGEPARPLAERLLPDSRWRDVAGMLRSFDYAPRVAVMISATTDTVGDEQRAYRAREWALRNREAFLAAYAGRDLTADERTLLDAYVADKAVYEAVYEVRNRPDWVSIPLEALAEVSAGS